MPEFTEKQLKELEKLYGLDRNPEIRPVRDGLVQRGQMVWFRSGDGVLFVNSGDVGNWAGIYLNPKCYQIHKPAFTLSYLD